MRRIIAGVVVIIGAALIVAPFALHLFSRADAAEKLSAAVRPSMTSQGLAGLQSDFDVAFAAGDQFIRKTIPALATALHETPAQFSAYVGTNFPSVATGVSRWYEMSDDARRDITIIRTHQREFNAADSIPTKSISLTTGVWGFIALGGLLLLAGLWMFTSDLRVPVALALILGLAGVAIPLALTFPTKASQTDRVYRSLQDVLSRQEVDRLQTNLGVVQKMVPELTGKLIPALEAQLHLTPAAFGALVQTNFPAVAKGLANFEPILGRMSARVAVMDAGVPLYASTSKIPFDALPWLFIGPGALIALCAYSLLMHERGKPIERVISRPGDDQLRRGA